MDWPYARPPSSELSLRMVISFVSFLMVFTLIGVSSARLSRGTVFWSNGTGYFYERQYSQS
jgi:hypothetical protein